MLRSRRLALALVLLPASASAQLEVSSVSDPFRPDRAPLALTDEVPAIFHLGLDGPAPVFVNPARAAHARQRFVYGTVRPSFSAEQPVSLAGLFGRGDRRWLVSADNGVLRREQTEARTTVRQAPGPPPSTRTDEQTTENELVATATRARVVLVSHTDFGGVAFGLFGGYGNATRRNLFASASTTTDPNGNATQTDRRRDDSSRDGFGVGAEVALAGRTWDLAGAVSYQGRAASAELSRTARAAFGSDVFEQASETLAEGDPAAVDFEVVGALRMGRKRADYLYGSVAGTFGGSTVQGRATVEADGALASGSEDAEVGTQATQASLGYVYARTHRGLTVLAAINPVGGVAHTEAVRVVNAGSSDGAALSFQETDAATLALVLPLYVRFDVTRRLDAFGGGAYAYTYARTETTERPLLSLSPPGDAPGTSLEQTVERSSEAFTSSGALYAGAVFTFRSGLAAQASFRGNLAELTGWTVSLGYRF